VWRIGQVVRVVGDVGGACAGIGLVSSACGGGGGGRNNKVVGLLLGDRETEEARVPEKTGADGGHLLDGLPNVEGRAC